MALVQAGCMENSQQILTVQLLPVCLEDTCNKKYDNSSNNNLIQSFFSKKQRNNHTQFYVVTKKGGIADLSLSLW